MADQGRDGHAVIVLGSGESSEVIAADDDTVMKVYRPSAHPVVIDLEYRAATLAADLGLPAVRPIELTWHGDRRAIRFERVRGPTLLRATLRNPLRLRDAFQRLARLQHSINARPGEGLPNQRDVFWQTISQARVSERVKRHALRALERLPESDRFCHGDLHPENVLSTSAGLRVIDWQNASAGHPALDAARTVRAIRFNAVESRVPGLATVTRAFRGLAVSWFLDAYSAASGIPRSEIEACYLPLEVARLAGRTKRDEARSRALVDQLIAAERPHDASHSAAALPALAD